MFGTVVIGALKTSEAGLTVDLTSETADFAKEAAVVARTGLEPTGGMGGTGRLEAMGEAEGVPETAVVLPVGLEYLAGCCPLE